jgi:sulfur transfer protein SufE
MDKLNEAIKQVQELLLKAENKEFRESLRKVFYELLKKKYEALEELEEHEETEEKKELECLEKFWLHTKSENIREAMEKAYYDPL